MTHLIAVGGSKLVADLGSGQGGSGRLPLRTCSSNRTGEIPPSGMIVERGGNVIRLLDGTLTARLLATRQPDCPDGRPDRDRMDRAWEPSRRPKPVQLPTGIAVDAGGRIYVADLGNHRIVRVDDMTGAGWSTLGSQGSGVN